MDYEYKEVLIKLMLKEANEIEKALPLFAKAKAIVQEFDNKIYNVKLERRLEDVGLSLEKDNAEIGYRIINDSISYGEYYAEYINTLKVSFSHAYNCKGVVVEKRINAKTWCALIDKRYEYWQGRIAALRHDAGCINDVIAKFKKLTKEREDLLGRLDSSTLDYFRAELKR